MKLNIMGYLRTLFDNKKFLVALSVVLAIIFWLVVDLTQNPSRDVTVDDVKIVLADQVDDGGNTLAPVSQSIESVSVTVNGPGYIVGTVSKNSVSVSVSSYAEITKPGKYVLNLTATVDKSGCTVTKISPSYIQVVYDYNAEKSVPVEVDASDYLPFVATDCEIFKSTLRNNSDGAEIPELLISGPSEVVNKIAKVRVRPVIDKVKGVEENTNFVPVLAFLDEDGEEVDASQLRYNTDTYVRIVIYKTADVSLIPTFTNLPDHFKNSSNGLPGYKLSVYDELTGKETDISKVKIKGPVSVVDNLKASGLKLSSIDFASVTPSQTAFNVSFVLDEGVLIVDGTEEVKVKLNIGTLKTKTFTIQPSKVKFKNLPQGMSASVSYKKGIKVAVCGSANQINLVDANDITLVIDCLGITAATVETKKLSVAFDKGVDAWVNSIDPQEVSVTIE